jgi:hypothetical protein
VPQFAKHKQITNRLSVRPSNRNTAAVALCSLLANASDIPVGKLNLIHVLKKKSLGSLVKSD